MDIHVTGRRVLVVDAGSPRNAPAGHVHNVLGREGTPPAELLERGRAEVRGYGGQAVAGEVGTVSRTDGGFALTLADAALEKFGGDSVAETRRNARAYLDALPYR